MITFLQKRPYASSANFSVCEYNNCEITSSKRFFSRSDAVMFEGRRMPVYIPYKRPRDQIWIFVEHEAPPAIENMANETRNLKNPKYGVKKYRDAFNWTMTYDKKLADIHLPYGELRQYKDYVRKDYKAIALRKTKGALIVTSHCSTESKRLEYLMELKKHIDLTILGTCGTKWNCGKWLYHDDCFSIMNRKYAFYLAFENALCNQYFTEKLFENFKYDTLFVTRGGSPHEAEALFPKGSVIDADAYESPAHLGKTLTAIARNKPDYAKRLAIKSQYYSIDFRESYQRALCDLCRRLNHQDIYYKTIPDVLQVLSKKQSCRESSGVQTSSEH
ncbi:fucosyltransferase 4 (alpha (1 3) fucosyltransferase myeloid-specific) [Mactra antiquata]